MKRLILVVNPGNVSTKIGVYDHDRCVFADTIRHTEAELSRFPGIPSQRGFRKELILKTLKRRKIPLTHLAAVAARGGLLRPLASGTYRVNDRMLRDLMEAKAGQHAANLGGLIGYEIAREAKTACYVVDPVSVDESQPLARYSGHRLFRRIMLTHALNMKAVARRFAEESRLDYRRINVLVVHLGTGVSLSIHRRGRMIDAVNPREEGTFSMDRSGGLPVMQVARYIIEKRIKYPEFEKMVFGNGGVFSYLGTQDFIRVRERYLRKDRKAVEVVRAMAYQIAKDAGALATVVEGDVDAVLITGGIAHNVFFVEMIRKRIAFIAPVFVYPGEDEMQALADGVWRVFFRQEKPRIY
jgi:butyrate kinase